MNGVNASQQQQIVWLAVKIPAVESGGAGAFRGAVLGNVAGFNGATLASGMTNYIFVAYSNALAALILLHLSLLVHSYLSLSQMLSSFIQGWVKKGLFCRNSKTLGTLVFISGAFVATLYKGPESLTNLLSPKLHYAYIGVVAGKLDFGRKYPAELVIVFFYCFSAAILSKFVSVISDCNLSVWSLQPNARLIVVLYSVVCYVENPAELVIVFFYGFSAAILSKFVSVISDCNLSVWSLQPNARLIVVLYSEVNGSAFQVSVTAWCLHKRSPFRWNVSSIGDHDICCACLLGSINIVVGFYSVMWGKAKEVKVIEKSNNRLLCCPLRMSRLCR
ncbi:hypothetical protein SASPL_140275 [Salvia splendens]|uniref:Uncharacterized protein n=1 Tax=Salvia splendens TaxID=180675 RepID=A0A8X8ZCB9_SALSN|nr:hypothetical protein SASPL_140275 [Salvia splendens]